MKTLEQKQNVMKWVEAAMSGQYTQGQVDCYRADNPSNPCYCILGVGEDVAGGSYRALSSSMATAWVNEDGYGCQLSNKARDFYGLATVYPYVWYRGAVHTIVGLNDGLKLSLPQLGQIILDQGPEWDGMPAERHMDDGDASPDYEPVESEEH